LSVNGRHPAAHAIYTIRNTQAPMAAGIVLPQSLVSTALNAATLQQLWQRHCSAAVPPRTILDFGLSVVVSSAGVPRRAALSLRAKSVDHPALYPLPAGRRPGLPRRLPAAPSSVPVTLLTALHWLMAYSCTGTGIRYSIDEALAVCLGGRRAGERHFERAIKL
jgi:hypothetical protein